MEEEAAESAPAVLGRAALQRAQPRKGVSFAAPQAAEGAAMGKGRGMGKCEGMPGGSRGTSDGPLQRFETMRLQLQLGQAQGPAAAKVPAEREAASAAESKAQVQAEGEAGSKGSAEHAGPPCRVSGRARWHGTGCLAHQFCGEGSGAAQAALQGASGISSISTCAAHMPACMPVASRISLVFCSQDGAEASAAAKAAGALMVREDQEEGHVSLRVYLRYIAAFGGLGFCWWAGRSFCRGQGPAG